VTFAVLSKIFTIKEIREGWFLNSPSFTSNLSRIVVTASDQKLKDALSSDVQILGKMFSKIAGGMSGDSPEMESLLETYVHASKETRDTALETLFCSGLKAFRLKDKLDDVMVDTASSLAVLFSQAESLLIQSKRGSPTKSPKGARSAPKGPKGRKDANSSSTDPASVNSTLEALCAESFAAGKVVIQFPLFATAALLTFVFVVVFFLVAVARARCAGVHPCRDEDEEV